MPGWDMAKTMCQAGGAGLNKVIAAAEDAMPLWNRAKVRRYYLDEIR